MTSAPEQTGSSGNVGDANSRNDWHLTIGQRELFEIELGCLGQIRESFRFGFTF
jgi:hypothetical protein